MRSNWCSVPGSIKSGLVSTPTVRRPSGSTSAASCSASAVARSAVHGTTTRIIVFRGAMYLLISRFVSAGTSLDWPSVATRASPGRSTRVRSGTSRAVTRTRMTVSVTPPFFAPGSKRMVAFMAAPTSAQGTRSSTPPWALIRAVQSESARARRSSTGARVTTPAPRRRGTPEMASSTLDLPALWSPMTTIAGKSNWAPRPMPRRRSLRSSTSRTSGCCW
mmetsp:Transcript_18853/g.63714  ORF Transcript_18853/g.63714 Transcript_18853/m.63714 type:complete len:220 (+) Transcript_18853:291-950(+)